MRRVHRWVRRLQTGKRQLKVLALRYQHCALGITYSGKKVLQKSLLWGVIISPIAVHIYT